MIKKNYGRIFHFYGSKVVVHLEKSRKTNFEKLKIRTKIKYLTFRKIEETKVK